MTDWLDAREAQCGPDEVWACPVCGAEVLLSCYHDGWTEQAKIMQKAEAQRLREESGEYDPMTFKCDVCGEEKPLAPGARIGNGYCCATCATVGSES